MICRDNSSFDSLQDSQEGIRAVESGCGKLENGEWTVYKCKDCGKLHLMITYPEIEKLTLKLSKLLGRTI